MNFLKFIKHLIFFLTFLLGTQTSYAKTKLVFPKIKVSFSIEQNQNFHSLEKVIQTNLVFLKEKVRFVASEGVSAQNQLGFSEKDVSNLVNGVAKHPNWVEVLNIRNIINAKTPHVLRIDINSSNSGFTGCHSKIALDDYVSNHPTSTYEFRNKILDPSGNGVYEAKPILILDSGVELGKVNNGGVSSFFPNNWNEAKILDEVEFAIANNHGKIPSKPNGNEYYGFSADGTVEIHFYLKQDGTLGSYFPVKN